MEPSRSLLPNRGGRPRSDEAHARILAASIALVREVGYDALAMDAIAERAGVGKATVYRRWSSKEALVAEAVEGILRRLPQPDTGSLERDLLSLLRDSAAMYAEPQSPALLSSLIAAMARSERIAAAVREGFVAARREAIRRVLKRARKRGELRRGLDLELALDVFSGPLLYRSLVTGAAVDARVLRRMVELFLRGVAAEGRGGRER